MENNCLVTKLNGVIDNDNIPHIDSFFVTTKEIGNLYYKLVVKSTETVHIKAKGDAYMADTIEHLSTNPVTERSGTNVTCFFPSADFTYEIDNKYKITYIYLEQCNAQGSAPTSLVSKDVIDVSAIGYCPIGEVYFLGTAYGDLKAMRNIPITNAFYVVSCTNFENASIDYLPLEQHTKGVLIQGSNIGSGDVGDNFYKFAQFKSITSVYMNTYIKGSVEDYVAACVNNIYGHTTPRTTGSIVFTFRGSQVTFGTYKITDNMSSGTLSWDGINRIFIVGDSKVMAKGATAEEIAAWETAGKTVIVIN